MLVNGAGAATAGLASPGRATTCVCVSRSIPTRTRPQAQAIALDILYEDDDLLAVNKPAGLVVHPSFGNLSGTLMNGLLDRARLWPSGSKPALLGRLDKLTSGIVLVTKRTEIYTALQRTMDARRIDKDYLAIVRGKPSPPARHHQPRTRSRSVGSPPHHRDRSWRTTVGDALRAPLDSRRLLARAMPPHHRPHASDPRAPRGEGMADCRRRDYGSKAAPPVGDRRGRQVSETGPAFVADGISPATNGTRARDRGADAGRHGIARGRDGIARRDDQPGTARA